jgi:hypothetical protein
MVDCEAGSFSSPVIVFARGETPKQSLPLRLLCPPQTESQ